MAESQTLLDNLKDRRVPQLVGMYIAATWLVIELGDWATERFNLPPNLTSYVFVAMLVMLPGVILFAWNHGAPGKDRWTRTEKIFIPTNGAIAVAVLYFASPALVVEAATETVAIPDETGVVQEFVVARQGHHRDVVGFFWENESVDRDLDWLSYGLPAMLAYDMNRVSPTLTVETPFDSSAIRSELRNRGYGAMLDEPQGLRIEITRERLSAGLITGSFNVDGEFLTASASVYDVENGSIIGTHSATGDDWFDIVDEISAALLGYLEVEPSDNASNDPVAQHFTDSLVAVRHFINGMVAISFSNDYAQGIAELQRAVEIDPGFAEASGELSQSHYFNGDTGSARTAVADALRNSYRLSETSSFVLKANRYVFEADYERAGRVVDMWTQVQPNSKKAFEAQAQLAKLSGGDEGLDKAITAYDRILELEPTAVDVYLEKAVVEQQRGDYAAATGYLMLYLETRPDSAEAHRQLAGIHQSQGDLDAAQTALETASVLSDNPLNSELGLARLEARRGLFAGAESRLERQLSNDLPPQQLVQVLSTQVEVAIVRGQIDRALGLLEEIGEASSSFMAPMIRLVSVAGQRPTILALLGRFDEAVSEADEITAELQPPFKSFMNFKYTYIYRLAGDREGFREWANRSQEIASQLPGPMKSFLAAEAAQLAIWDADTDAATAQLDRSNELLGQSMLQVLEDNLPTSTVHVTLAELYLEAGTTEKAAAKLESLLRVFPSYGYAKLVLARVRQAEDDAAAAQVLLQEALESWSDADENYIHRVAAEQLLREL
jgi:tetratricopeptide (TPR) repeat protein